jgi:hypothetical protein
VAIVVAVRRFRCGDNRCERKVFVERISPVMATHARRSRRLADIQRHIGMAPGGAAGGRLAFRLALPASGDTLLRLVRRGASVQPPPTPPTVIGIDDFAWKRGQLYGAVICDLERRRILDLLPDRQPATVEAWMARHPSVNVAARDRGAGYGRAVARACPEATQVVDRWHLMGNASAAFLQAVRQSMRAIRRALAAGTVDPDLLTSANVANTRDAFVARPITRPSGVPLVQACRSRRSFVALATAARSCAISSAAAGPMSSGFG